MAWSFPAVRMNRLPTPRGPPAFVHSLINTFVSLAAWPGRGQLRGFLGGFDGPSVSAAFDQVGMHGWGALGRGQWHSVELTAAVAPAAGERAHFVEPSACGVPGRGDRAWLRTPPVE